MAGMFFALDSFLLFEKTHAPCCLTWNCELLQQGRAAPIPTGRASPNLAAEVFQGL